MNVDVVADVGNSRIKWGVCSDHTISTSASLPPDDPTAWQKQLSNWNLNGSLSWAIGGVHPARLKALRQWLRQRGDKVCLLERYDQLPLEVRVEAPERVGMDRLLNAAAARFRLRRGARGRPPKPAVIVDAGTAVTVDFLSSDGAFEGGAIFPGRLLMAKALHDYTALLPFIVGENSDPPPVGKNTAAAIETGVHHAAAGGINQLIRRQLAAQYPRVNHPGRPVVFLTGGDASLLRQSIDGRAVLWPEMTLEGLRLSAEALP